MKAWLVRDKDEKCFIHESKPVRDIRKWVGGTYLELSDTNIPADLAAKVTWEGEPVEVEITIKETGNDMRNVSGVSDLHR